MLHKHITVTVSGASEHGTVHTLLLSHTCSYLLVKMLRYLDIGQNFGQEQHRTTVKTANDFETDPLNIFFSISSVS